MLICTIFWNENKLSPSKFKNQYNMSFKKSQGVFFFKSGKLMMKVHFEKYRDDTCQEYFE